MIVFVDRDEGEGAIHAVWWWLDIAGVSPHHPLIAPVTNLIILWKKLFGPMTDLEASFSQRYFDFIRVLFTLVQRRFDERPDIKLIDSIGLELKIVSFRSYSHSVCLIHNYHLLCRGRPFIWQNDVIQKIWLQITQEFICEIVFFVILFS